MDYSITSFFSFSFSFIKSEYITLFTFSYCNRSTHFSKMAYSWDNRVMYIIRYFYGEFLAILFTYSVSLYILIYIYSCLLFYVCFHPLYLYISLSLSVCICFLFFCWFFLFYPECISILYSYDLYSYKYYSFHL